MTHAKHNTNGTATHSGDDTAPLNKMPVMNATAKGSTGQRERDIGNHISLKSNVSRGI